LTRPVNWFTFFAPAPAILNIRIDGALGLRTRLEAPTFSAGVLF